MARAAFNAGPGPEVTLENLYLAFSYGPGEEMDRDRVRELFLPGARLIFASESGDTEEFREFTVDEFMDATAPGDPDGTRDERELWRRVEIFGNVAHVFSAYELTVTRAGGSVTRRGINSVQLCRNEGRWLVVSLCWDVDRPGSEVPL